MKRQTISIAAGLFASAFAVGAVRAADCNMAAGAKSFQDQQCAGCHTFVPDDLDKSGPNLHGVAGRGAGMANFPGYSDALKKSGIVWNAEALDRWLLNPAAVVPGTVMPFADLPDVDARATLVCYVIEKSK